MIYCGIDEAGYGPRLGPLVAAATFARTRRPRRCPVRVADSKKMYTPRRGIGALEPTALGFAGQVMPLDGLTYRKLRAQVAGPVPDLPWYGDFDLPWSQSDIPVDDVKSWLGDKNFGMAARVVEPESINRSSNKASLLFREVAGLLRQVLDTFPDDPVTFRIGKQGGRRFYAALLLQELGVPVRVRRELPGRSTYYAELEKREVIFDFLRDGEDRDFYLALSSVLAKYLREGAMRLFNEYWQQRVPGLRPTAGYGTDGLRFYRDIEPTLHRLALSPEAIFRSR